MSLLAYERSRLRRRVYASEDDVFTEEGRLDLSNSIPSDEARKQRKV
jgi:hypothetical protein